MFNGTVVAKMIEQKHLDLRLINHLSIFLSRKTLDQMYKSLVHSHLDYCDILYHIPSVQTQLGLTQVIQWKKLKEFNTKQLVLSLVHGRVQVVPNSEEVGWESLSERCWCRCILQLHKILSNKRPSYLPSHCRPLYSQNNNNTLHLIRCRSSRYMNSFFPDAIISWDNFITHFDNIPSINILKDHILTMILLKKKNIFGIHDPLVLRYLLKLSGLKFLKTSQKCQFH